MKKRILRMIALVVLCMIFAVTFAGCDETDDVDRETEVRGYWKLKSVETVRVTQDYADTWGEVSVKCYSEDYTHFVKYSYTPDAEDPSDGPTPYSAIFYCTVDLPKEVEPTLYYNAIIDAKVDSDGNPGHTGGICCFFGIRDSDIYETYSEGKDVYLSSKGKYNYSYRETLYPVYAGSPTGYGHLNDQYQESMRDSVEFSFPFVEKAALDKAGSDPVIIKLSFCSNAAETVFVYEYVPKK